MGEHNKQVLILGATSDMAMAIGREFVKHGFDLILAARNVTRLEPYSLDIKNKDSVEVELVEFDALDYASHSQFISSVSDNCEVAVCAFGYLGDQDVAESDWNETHKIIDANYTGAVSVLNCIAEKWKPLKRGTILGISSVAGDRGRSSNYIYGSAKAAFTTYLDGLRNSLYHHQIHVTTIKPGFVATKMTSHLELPDKLTSSPEQVAVKVFKAYTKKVNTVYVSGIWNIIMMIIKMIPEPIFKKLKM